MILGLTAGFVNAAGFLAFAVLTTNITGHAALFAERVALQDWKTAKVVALWMFLFFFRGFYFKLNCFDYQKRPALLLCYSCICRDPYLSHYCALRKYLSGKFTK
nr:DUF1275 family protein [Mucilaginibacter gilvus]